MNPGKQFERDWKKSVTDDMYIQRMIDPVQSFLTGPNAKFSPKRPYDFFMYKFPILFCLELKSKGTRNVTYYRDDFLNSKTTEDDFDIKKHQIEGLLKARECPGVLAGFVINFRIDDETYFFDIDDFIWLIDDLPKKSFNAKDIVDAGGFRIDSHIVRTRPHYDLDKFYTDAKRYLQHEERRKGSKHRARLYEKEPPRGPRGRPKCVWTVDQGEGIHPAICKSSDLESGE